MSERFETETVLAERGSLIEDFVIVPLLQAAACSAAVGLAAGVLAAGVGAALLDVTKPFGVGLKVGGGVGCLTLAILVVWFVWEERHGQPEAPPSANPDPVRVEVTEGKTMRFADLPLDRTKLRAVAAALNTGTSFSRPGLVDRRHILTQTEYHRLSAAMEKGGLVIKLPGNRRELTASGRAMMRRLR